MALKMSARSGSKRPGERSDESERGERARRGALTWGGRGARTRRGRGGAGGAPGQPWPNTNGASYDDDDDDDDDKCKRASVSKTAQPHATGRIARSGEVVDAARRSSPDMDWRPKFLGVK